MKPVYKCEYCDQMGTKEKIEKHEVECIFNYDRKSCWTCKNRDPNSLFKFKCLLGKEIPEHHIMEFCGNYEWNEQTGHSKDLRDIFGGLFGG